MKKDEIKKALEICADDCYSCDDCPYDDVINCGNTLKNDVRELIVEQEKEIERLETENDKLTKVVSSKVYDFVNNIVDETTTHLDIEKQAKIDVLKELKERIETAIDTYWNSNGGGYYLAEDAIDDIDELIEEVENDK